MPKHRISPRYWLALAVLLCAGGGLAAWALLSGKHFYLFSLVVFAFGFGLLALSWERQKPSAARLVVLAVLCAAAIAGRGLFAALPQCKPVVAVVIVTGLAFGPGDGFLAGAVTAFASNFMFGQGPWTPWQMFAFGLPGFLAGWLGKAGLLSGKRLPLALFGLAVTLLLVGPVLNLSTLAFMGQGVSAAAVGAVFLSGLPFDLVHGLSTGVFLFLLGPFMLEKLARVRIKYGMTPPEDPS